MTQFSSIALRVVLVLVGASILFTGLNVALGGIMTLGWQGERDFIAVTDEHAFQVHDSHTRFLGGLWLGVGLLFLVGATDLRRRRDVLTVAFALTFLAGFARLSQFRSEVLFGPDILGSWIAEIVGMPLLYFWLSRVTAPVHRR